MSDKWLYRSLNDFSEFNPKGGKFLQRGRRQSGGSTGSSGGRSGGSGGGAGHHVGRRSSAGSTGSSHGGGSGKKKGSKPNRPGKDARMKKRAPSK